MTAHLRRPGGRQRTKAFYERALSAAEREGLDEARALSGVDEEIALLRLRLRDALAAQPEDWEVLLGGVRLLIQALLAQRRLSGQQAEEMSEQVLGILEGFGEAMRGLVDVSN